MDTTGTDPVCKRNARDLYALYCTKKSTITPFNCLECDQTSFMTLDTSTTPDSCKRIDTSTPECSTWLNGDCTACTDAGKILVNGKCVWDGAVWDNKND